MTLEVNSILNNRYLILEIIAHGGMGSIYRAYDQSLNISVAVKENLFISIDSTRQFHREATILAGMRHPNLPRVIDHFEMPDQGQYLAMDYIEGEDLRERINRYGVLSEVEIILIGSAICDALIYMHSRIPPIIHRDIKPGNIKITPDRHYFLVDFGLAKADQGLQTTIGAQSLTPGYAPPEQYGQGTDNRSDIYALGATLYAGLTAKVPEDGLARAMMAATLTPIRKHNPKVSEDVGVVLERAMAVQPSERYQTAELFKQGLFDTNIGRRILNGENGGSNILPIELKNESNGSNKLQLQENLPSNATDSSSGFKNINKSHFQFIPVLVVGIIILCFFMVGGGLIIFKNRNQNQQIELPTNQPILSDTKTIIATFTKEVESTLEYMPVLSQVPISTETKTPVITPVGGRGQIAFASDRTGLPQIWLMDAEDAEVKQLTNLPDGACQPDWSPDASMLIFTSPCRTKQDIYKGASLFFIKPDGSSLFPLPSVPGGDFDPAWSPDGSQIIFSSIRNGNYSSLYIYDVKNHSTQRLFKTNTNDRRPAWSPDGQFIAFETTRLDQEQIWITDSAGENPIAFSNPESSSYMAVWSSDGKVIVFSQGSNLPWLSAKQISSNSPEFRISDIRPALNADFSPDGFWLLFEGLVEGDIELFRMMVNGSNITRMTSQYGKDFDPVWQP